MNYIAWAVVALACYSVFTPLASLATNSAPSHVVALITNSILAVSAVAVTLYRGDHVAPYLFGDTGLYIAGAGAFLSVGILAYYRALAGGPVSVVVPIFGSFIVGSAAIGVAFLGEPLTGRKVAGVALTLFGVYLVAG